jgi:hypothetical protein
LAITFLKRGAHPSGLFIVLGLLDCYPIHVGLLTTDLIVSVETEKIFALSWQWQPK